VPDCVSSCRLGKWAKAAAGKRSGTAGATSGQASLTWAFAAAAGWCLRTHPAGQKSLARWEKTHGKGQALTGLAPQLARAVSPMVKRDTAFALPMVLPSEAGAERVSLTPHGPRTGCACRRGSAMTVARRRACRRAHRPAPGACPLAWPSAPALARRRASRTVHVGCPSPAPDTPWRTGSVPSPLCIGRYEGTERLLGRRDSPEQSLHASSPRREHLTTCLGQPVGAPADGNADSTRCQRRMTLSLNPSGKKWEKTAPRGSLSLDNGGPHTGSAQSWVALVGTLGFCESADMQDFPGMHGSNIVLRQG
jgi:hypothetical protein